MKRLSLSIAAFGLAITAFAQKNTGDPEKYAKLITAEDAKKHLSILASDEFEGRETGKPGADKAAHYLEGEFKKLGLQAPVNGSYFLDIPLVENSLKVSFSINGIQAAANGVDFLTRSNAADKAINANEIVFVGYGTEAELSGTDIAGKVILLVNEDKPEAGKTTNTSYRATASRNVILKNLQSKNPALILASNGEIADLMKRFGSSVTGGRLTIKTGETKTATQQAAVVHITTALADQLVKSSGKTYDELKSTNAQTIKVDVKADFRTESKDVKAVDVLGFLPGTDLKDEVLVFSAHYDHIGLNPNGKDKVNNGADDDGSGTTGILEIARAFMQAKKDGHGPRRSVLFLGNVGEEKGLLGSEYYTDHPVFPLY